MATIQAEASTADDLSLLTQNLVRIPTMATG
jgi:hypothetical protein